MVEKSILDAAKAFLCWDVFERLTIQLVAVRQAVAYYYPPQNSSHTIVIFYKDQDPDFSCPLFLLFHEAGHARQWDEVRADDFRCMLSLDRGSRKQAFERRAWELGRKLFVEFVEKHRLGTDLVAEFDRTCAECLESYC